MALVESVNSVRLFLCFSGISDVFIFCMFMLNVTFLGMFSRVTSIMTTSLTLIMPKPKPQQAIPVRVKRWVPALEGI